MMLSREEVSILAIKSENKKVWQKYFLELAKREAIKFIEYKQERGYALNDSDVVNTPELKYFAVCSACGKTHQKARIKLKEIKRACICQIHKSWDEKILIEFKARY